ncbi:MAG: CNNM domain-containing protein [Bacteroidales bacterium]
MALLLFYLLLALVISFTCSVLEAVLLSTPTSYLEVVKHEIRLSALREGPRGQAEAGAKAGAHTKAEAQAEAGAGAHTGAGTEAQASTGAHPHPKAKAKAKARRSNSRSNSRSTGLSPKNRRKLKSLLLFSKVKENIDRSLSAILSLNTVAHTVGAAGVGVQSAKIFGDAYAGATSAILTFLILILSEIIPKSVGAKYWRHLVFIAGQMIEAMVWICYPLVVLSKGITWLISHGKSEPGVSREEVSALVNMGSKEGLFAQEELQGLRSLLGLQELRVRDIMTPRIVTVTANEDMTLKEFYQQKNYLKYSRIPVYIEGDPENITGFVLLKNVFEQLAQDRFDMPLKAIKRPIIVALESQKLLSLWNRMQQGSQEDSIEEYNANGEDFNEKTKLPTAENPKENPNSFFNEKTKLPTAETMLVPPTKPTLFSHKKRAQIAMVVDEYGSFVGIVTVEDMVETMLGLEIVDEKDTITDLQEYARKRWQKNTAPH